METSIRITGGFPNLSHETFHMKGPVGLVAPGDGHPLRRRVLKTMSLSWTLQGDGDQDHGGEPGVLRAVLRGERAGHGREDGEVVLHGGLGL